MDMAKVIGTVVAEQRDAALESYHLAIVQPVDENMKEEGSPVVALDPLNRQNGDLVYIVRSGDAMAANRGTTLIPVDCAIAGLIDDVKITTEKRESR